MVCNEFFTSTGLIFNRNGVVSITYEFWIIKTPFIIRRFFANSAVGFLGLKLELGRQEDRYHYHRTKFMYNLFSFYKLLIFDA